MDFKPFFAKNDKKTKKFLISKIVTIANYVITILF